jgi:outer membrane protein assembly factor BamB
LTGGWRFGGALGVAERASVVAGLASDLSAMKLIPLLLCAVAIPGFAAENWPQFRGPAGDGHTDGKGLPVEFGEENKVKWKAPTHGKAWSSPVVWGNEVWLTTATGNGKELGVMAFNSTTGKLIQDKTLFRVETPQFCHAANSYASPTPVIEEGRIYVSYGSPGIACVDTKTCEVLWERRDFVCNHFRGAGSSPIVWNDLLIQHFDGSDRQFLVALDKKTGKTVWEVKRSVDYNDIEPSGKVKADGDWRKAFGTPHVIDWQGTPLLLSSGAKAHYAYDPASGREIWRIDDPGHHSAAVRPVAGLGMVFIAAGYSQGEVFALKLGGSGVLDQSGVAWRLKKAAPNKPSLILDGELLYMINDGGIASCVEAKTGNVLWSQRVQGSYSASPLLADGRLYVFNEEGKVGVLKAGREFQLLAENQFESGFMASPAVSGKALFLRTKTALYRVEE